MAEGSPSDAGSDDGAAARTKSPAVRRKRFPWRSWLRATHRDVGYLLVGLTFVYAISGLAVNHIDDWDANFVESVETHQLAALPKDDAGAARVIRERLAIDEQPDEIYRVDEGTLELLFDDRTLTANLNTGEVVDEQRKARFFVRAVNWLHLNRGKRAWTYIADGYAALLLMLALSGAFMLPGRKGLFGRGAILIGIGCAVPILYVTLSGGP